MRKIITYLFLCLVSCFSFAQDYFSSSTPAGATPPGEMHVPQDPEDSFYGEIYGNYSWGSNSITNSLVNEMFIGSGFISNDLKQDVQDQLQSEDNTLGFESEIGFLMKYRFPSKQSKLLFGLRNVDLARVDFTEHTANLLLNGNQPYAGQTLQLAPFHFTNLTYQTIDIGLQRNLKNEKTSWFAFASLVKGVQYQNANMSEGTLFTAADGSEVTLTTDLSYEQVQVEEVTNKLAMFEGFGASISGGVSHRAGKHKFDLMLRDLGWVSYWNISSLEVNNNYEFDGIEVDDILNIQDEFSLLQTDDEESSLESVLEVESKETTKDYILPAKLYVGYEYQLNTKVALKAQVSHYFSIYKNPRVVLQGHFALGKTTEISPLFMYTGFGNFNSGLQVQQQVFNNYFIRLQAYLFESLIAPKTTQGSSMAVQLYCKF